MEEMISIDQVIDSDSRIAVVQTAEPERLLGLFKRMTLTTGRAIYDWSPDNGLYRLGIEHIFIPRTRTAADVLAYIVSSRHYGIYLLRNFTNLLGSAEAQKQLVRLAEKQDNVRRLVFVVSEEAAIPAALQPFAARVVHTVKEKATGTAG